jgi:hypothetical protein
VSAPVFFRQLAGCFPNYLQIAGDTIYDQLICDKRVVIHLRGIAANLLNSQQDVFDENDRGSRLDIDKFGLNLS